MVFFFYYGNEPQVTTSPPFEPYDLCVENHVS